MFGDRTLLGTYEVSVDSKNRIALPAKTNREAGDELVLVFDKDVEKYAIHKLKDIENKIKYYDDRIDITNSEDEIKKLKTEEYKYAKAVKDLLTVDVQGRIILTSNFSKYTKLTLVGCGNVMYIDSGKEKKTNTK